MNEIINHIMRLKQRHHITKLYCDGANPEVIRELKNRIGEYHDYYGRLTEEDIWFLRSSNSWQIIPVNFQKRHREMLQWTYTLMSMESWHSTASRRRWDTFQSYHSGVAGLKISSWMRLDYHLLFGSRETNVAIIDILAS